MGRFISNVDSFHFTASTKDIFKALISEAQWLSLIKLPNNEVKALIDIIQKEAKNSESEGFKTPSIKALSKGIGLTSAKITKFINQLYDDLWDLNLNQPKLFTSDSAFCTFYFKDGFGQQYAFFNLKVTHPINVGDGFSWTFLLGKFSSTTFYIESIDHEHIKGEMVGNIDSFEKWLL